MSGVKEEHRASREQARAKLRTQLLSAASEKRGALSDIYDTNTIVEHIRKINPQMAVSKTKTKMVAVAVYLISLVLLVISLIGAGYVLFALFSNNSAYCVRGLAIFGVSIVVGILLDRYEKRLSEARKKEHQDELAYLSALYDRWLELITNQTRSRNAEAQQAHQQALEQAKQRFSNSLQQLRPTVLDYTNSADQISPPWQSETWQNWRPGMLTPGVVRLGVFTLQPDQLAVKSATISQSKHLAPGTVVGGEIINPGKAKIPDD
jgi:flagellar basal body-associated protein FliL